MSSSVYSKDSSQFSAGSEKSDGGTYLVVTSTEDELGVRVLVQNPFDDLALVDGDGSHFQVLLADEDLNWPLVGQIVFEKILTLSALKLSESQISDSLRHKIHRQSTHPHSGSLER